MRFETSDIPIEGQRFRLAYARKFPDAADACYWASLWPSSVALAAHVAGQGGLEGREVLELGCGCGLAGIAAGREGARVTVTDRVPEALELAAGNWSRNGLAPAGVERLDWRRPRLETRFDWILGADILYDASLFPALVGTVKRLLRRGGRLVIAEPGRPQAHGFFARMLQAGYRVETRHHRVSLHGEDFEIGVSEIS